MLEPHRARAQQECGCPSLNACLRWQVHMGPGVCAEALRAVQLPGARLGAGHCRLGRLYGGAGAARVRVVSCLHALANNAFERWPTARHAPRWRRSRSPSWLRGSRSIPCRPTSRKVCWCRRATRSRSSRCAPSAAPRRRGHTLPHSRFGPLPCTARLRWQCLDEVAISPKMREQLREFYPEAKVAYLKTGGNFPYLSHADQVVMFIRVRARRLEPSPAVRARSTQLRPAPGFGDRPAQIHFRQYAESRLAPFLNSAHEVDSKPAASAAVATATAAAAPGGHPHAAWQR